MHRDLAYGQQLWRVLGTNNLGVFRNLASVPPKIPLHVLKLSLEISPKCGSEARSILPSYYERRVWTATELRPSLVSRSVHRDHATSSDRTCEVAWPSWLSLPVRAQSIITLLIRTTTFRRTHRRASWPRALRCWRVRGWFLISWHWEKPLRRCSGLSQPRL